MLTIKGEEKTKKETAEYSKLLFFRKVILDRNNLHFFKLFSRILTLPLIRVV